MPGASAMFSLLGEAVTDPSEADRAVAEYCALAAAIGDSSQMDARVAVKPTLLGLDISQQTARRGLLNIVETAAEHGVWVELDMEASNTVDATLDLYRAAAERSDRTAIALQAYLRRTPEDAQALIDEGIARVRLVKGAYSESGRIAHSGTGRNPAGVHRVAGTAVARWVRSGRGHARPSSASSGAANGTRVTYQQLLGVSDALWGADGDGLGDTCTTGAFAREHPLRRALVSVSDASDRRAARKRVVCPARRNRPLDGWVPEPNRRLSARAARESGDMLVGFADSNYIGAFDAAHSLSGLLIRGTLLRQYLVPS